MTVQHEHQHQSQTLTLTHHLFVQAAIVVVLVALVLWAVFFTNYPPVHDAFHELRHSLYIVPCH